MLTRVRTFGTTHGQLFPKSNAAHAAFATVSTELDRLEKLDVAERTAVDASRVDGKASARQLLADTLIRAGSTARVLAKADPKLDARVQTPLPKADLLLLTLARQFAASAAPNAAQFAAHGIPIAVVEGAIATFEAALAQRGMGREDRVRTRAEIEASFKRAIDAVEVLDVSVANCLGADPVAQTVWKTSRRVESARRSSGTAAVPEPAPSPLEPAAVLPTVPVASPVVDAHAPTVGVPPAVAA
jgi:hypothetical protein